MVAELIEHISNQVRVSIFFRSILENGFVAIRTRIRRNLLLGRKLSTLDLGCGAGLLSDLFAGGQYIGIDINPRYISYAREKQKGEFLVCDACQLALRERYFGQILIFGLLHHLSDREVEAVLSEALRVLAPGGRIFAIEDIPTASKFNILGRLVHHFEVGKHIRSVAEYRRLYSSFARVEGEEVFRSGVCDYYAAVLAQ